MNASHLARFLSSAVANVRRIARPLRASADRSDSSSEEHYLSQSVDAADFERRMRQLDAHSKANASLWLSFARSARP